MPHWTGRVGEAALDCLAVGVPFRDKSDMARRGHGQDERCRGDAWFMPCGTVQARMQKSHLAAAAEGARGVGIEIDPASVATTRAHLDAAAVPA